MVFEVFHKKDSEEVWDIEIKHASIGNIFFHIVKYESLKLTLVPLEVV